MKKELHKSIEEGIFTKLKNEDIYNIYSFYISNFVRIFKIKNPLLKKELTKKLEDELWKAVLLYKKNKRYKGNDFFLVYATYFLGEIANKYLDKYSNTIKK